MSTNTYTLESTTDYKSLSLHPKNRKVNPNHVKELRASIAEKNLLHLRPGAVGKNNVIIDGQHRLVVAKELEIPFYFVRDENVDIDDAPTLNMHQMNWSLEQWEHYWIESGITDYKKLRDFRTAHKLPISIAISLTYSQNAHAGGRDNDKFREGTYEFLHEDFAQDIAGMLDDFSKYVDFARVQTFIIALLRAVNSGEYDHQQMMEKLDQRPYDLKRQANSKNFARNLEDIFNWNKGPDQSARFYGKQ